MLDTTIEEAMEEQMDEFITTNPRINISNHAYERFVERIVGIADPTDRRQYINSNKEMLTDRIFKMWDYAKYIWSGQLHDNTTKRFWIRDNIVMVTDTGTTALVTLYRIDYGYKDDLNRQIAESILNDIETQRKELMFVEEDIRDTAERLELNLQEVQTKIKAHEDSIAALKQQSTAIKEQITAERMSADGLKRELELNFVRICNSLEYKREILGGKK